MIARRRVFAREHDIAEFFGRGSDATSALVHPTQRAGERHCLRDIEPQREIFARGAAPRALALAETAARAGIERAFLALRRVDGARDFRLDRGARTKARIDESHRVELFERGAVVVEMLRLAPHRAIPIEPEPFQVLDDRADERLAATRRIDVFDAEEELSAGLSRRAPADQGGIGMAKVKKTGWARCEARDDLGHCRDPVVSAFSKSSAMSAERQRAADTQIAAMPMVSSRNPKISGAKACTMRAGAPRSPLRSP